MPLPECVKELLLTIETAGYQAYAVGGCVRDMLLGIEPHDYDVTTSARPEEMMELFPQMCLPTGIKHGTVTVKWQGESFEITTFRSEGSYSDHRHPDSVAFSTTLSEDLKRRDFTIGAMAMDARGKITDLFHGKEDLRQGVIRCVGDAEERFEEDALRIMRGLRFAARFGFRIEPETEKAMHAKAYLLKEIAAERLREEMTALLCASQPGNVLLQYTDVFGVFLPEILPCVGLDQKNVHHIYDVWEHSVHALEQVEPLPVLRWTMLFHDLGKAPTFFVDAQGVGHAYGHGKAGVEIASEVMERLKFDHATRDRILTLVDWHDRVFPQTEKSIHRVLCRLGEECMRQLIAVQRSDNLAQSPEFRDNQKRIDEEERILNELLAKDACFTLHQMAVNGDDLVALGYRGKVIGQILNELFRRVVEEDLPNEREVLLEELKKIQQ